jgi:hypothetical protein
MNRGARDDLHREALEVPACAQISGTNKVLMAVAHRRIRETGRN